MIVNPYNTGRGDFDDDERLLTRVIHELAHSTGIKHDKTFYDAQRFFLKVATEEMGIKLDVNCRVCCEATEPCETVCPKCIWIDKDGKTTLDPAKCRPRKGVCKTDS